MKSGQSASAANLKKFQRRIHSYYTKHGRNLPWRNTKNPYHIFVSEVMLQQTQVDRVLPKYTLFLKKFPTLKSLAEASLKDVLLVWQGLGYNRRAKFLKQATEIIIRDYKGIIPRETKILEQLPSIGSYTAAAIVTFAFGGREVFVETNIRSVYIDYFFSKAKKVHDKKILSLIEQTLPKKDFREWYFGLMDYGAYLKKDGKNPSRRSAHFAKQSAFRGSNREMRGKILKLVSQKSLSRVEIKKALGEKSLSLLRELMREGFLDVKRGKVIIA